MALNPQYEDIGKGFVQQYYALFDDPTQRANLVHLFNVNKYLNFSLFLCEAKNFIVAAELTELWTLKKRCFCF